MGPESVPVGEPHRGYRFGAFALDIDRAALYENDRPVKLRPQSFDVLRYLVEHQGRLVEKQELLDEIWGDAAVTDDSLTHCLIDIRKAIGDTQRELVRTVPRRGFIFDMPVAPLASVTYRSDWRSTALRTLQIGALVLLVPGGAYLSLTQPETSVASVPTRDLARPARNSIAVLPFVDMSEGQNYAYFADGIAEEILNSLAQNPALQVIARTSSFRYRETDNDIARIAKELGVAHVLEGSVRTDGKWSRITAQLVNGETGTHLWSDTFDREMNDVLEVQTEIATSVSGILADKLLGGEGTDRGAATGMVQLALGQTWRDEVRELTVARDRAPSPQLQQIARRD